MVVPDEFEMAHCAQWCSHGNTKKAIMQHDGRGLLGILMAMALLVGGLVSIFGHSKASAREQQQQHVDGCSVVSPCSAVCPCGTI